MYESVASKMTLNIFFKKVEPDIQNSNWSTASKLWFSDAAL
jgi:hypothetical protein